MAFPRGGAPPRALEHREKLPLDFRCFYASRSARSADLPVPCRPKYLADARKRSTIVVEFTYRALPVDTVLGGLLVYRREKAGQILRHYRKLMKKAPDELSLWR